MIPTLHPLTYDDLRYMPDDGQRYEIIYGELFVAPAPTAKHQRVFVRLLRLLDAFTRGAGRGDVLPAPIQVILGHYDIVEPDIVYVSPVRARDSVPGDQRRIDFAPDLIVEVVSPTSRRLDLVRKMALYARERVPEYWIADADWQRFVINTLEGEQYAEVESDGAGLIGSRTLPGLRVDPAEVFAGLD